MPSKLCTIRTTRTCNQLLLWKISQSKSPYLVCILIEPIPEACNKSLQPVPSKNTTKNFSPHVCCPSCKALFSGGSKENSYSHHHRVLWIHKSANLDLITFYQWYLSHLINFQTDEIVLGQAEGPLGDQDNPFFFMIPVINPGKKAH